MKYKMSLFAVKDIKVTKDFYNKLFDMVVTEDYGENIVLDNILSFQQDFDKLAGVKIVTYGGNDAELFFETDDIEAFVKKISGYNIKYVHKLMQHTWGQRVVRIYDPDEHIIEIGESMPCVFLRMQRQGYDINQIAKTTQQPLESVKKVIDK